MRGISGAFRLTFFFTHHHVVVAAGLVDTNEHHATVAKTGIFNKLLTQLSLVVQEERRFTEAIQGGEHYPTDMGQALKGVVAAVIRTMAIGPLVIARNVDHWFFHGPKHSESVGVNVIGALRASVFDVTVIK